MSGQGVSSQGGSALAVRRALLAAALLCACADDPGPLAISTVAELALAKGDAEGYARSGVYEATLQDSDCDCPGVMIAPIQPADAPCIGGIPFVTFSVVQSDGILLFELQQTVALELVGALDVDGTFSLGSVDELSSVAGSGHHVARLDGEFDESGGFSGALAHRYDATILEQELKCSEHLTIDATRR